MEPKILLQKINELLNGRDWCYVGLRGMYAEETTGLLRPSHIWEDGSMTEDLLDGTCAIALGEWWDGPDFSDSDIEPAMRRAQMYGDGNIGVIIGNNAQAGEDIAEVILRDAECIFIAS